MQLLLLVHLRPAHFAIIVSPSTLSHLHAHIHRYVCKCISLFLLYVFFATWQRQCQSPYFASLDCCILWLQHWVSGHKLRNSMGPLKNTYWLKAMYVCTCTYTHMHVYVCKSFLPNNRTPADSPCWNHTDVKAAAVAAAATARHVIHISFTEWGQCRRGESVFGMH